MATSPSEERRLQFSRQRSQRTSTAPPPLARFGRRATGHPSESPQLDGRRRSAADSHAGEFLRDASGGTRLFWDKEPENVLVIKKYKDRGITAKFKEICQFLVEEKNLNVTVESAVLHEKDVRCAEFEPVKNRLRPWSCDDDDCDEKLLQIDFIVCLGGDGTLLYVSSLFQKTVPPILAFRLGSLGFLTSLDVGDYRAIITNVMAGSATVTLRSRLECTIEHNRPQSASPTVSNGGTIRTMKLPTRSAVECASPLERLPPADFALGRRGRSSSSVITSSTRTSRMLVLNEVVIDRGQSAFLSNLEIYCNNRSITDVQGDGLIVATPTGSTAYAAAAGASMVHPSVQAMVLTPICPHSLSFRPIMVPGGVNIEVRVPAGGRCGGAVSCDGKNRQELAHGDSVQITTSIYPLPCVDGTDHIADWFTSLSTCLHWNARVKQRQFDTDDEDVHHDHDQNADDEDGILKTA